MHQGILIPLCYLGAGTNQISISNTTLKLLDAPISEQVAELLSSPSEDESEYNQEKLNAHLNAVGVKQFYWVGKKM